MPETLLDQWPRLSERMKVLAIQDFLWWFANGGGIAAYGAMFRECDAAIGNVENDGRMVGSLLVVKIESYLKSRRGDPNVQPANP